MRQWRGMSRRGFGLATLGLAAGLGWGGRSAIGQSAGWTTLFDGKNLDHFDKLGDADWTLADGAVTATKGSGFLVTKADYGDFELRAEFWADEDANSGIFIRCTNRQKVGTDTAYEVNIYDKRPDPTYGTGAIVGIAKVEPMPKAANKWNTYEIVAKGDTFDVTFNGQKTVSGAKDSKFGRGAISLQYGPGVVKDKGVIKFRKVEIKPL